MVHQHLISLIYLILFTYPLVATPAPPNSNSPADHTVKSLQDLSDDAMTHILSRLTEKDRARFALADRASRTSVHHVEQSDPFLIIDEHVDLPNQLWTTCRDVFDSETLQRAERVIRRTRRALGKLKHVEINFPSVTWTSTEQKYAKWDTMVEFVYRLIRVQEECRQSNRYSNVLKYVAAHTMTSEMDGDSVVMDVHFESESSRQWIVDEGGIEEVGPEPGEWVHMKSIMGQHMEKIERDLMALRLVRSFKHGEVVRESLSGMHPYDKWKRAVFWTRLGTVWSHYLYYEGEYDENEKLIGDFEELLSAIEVPDVGSASVWNMVHTVHIASQFAFDLDEDEQVTEKHPFLKHVDEVTRRIQVQPPLEFMQEFVSDTIDTFTLPFFTKLYSASVSYAQECISNHHCVLRDYLGKNVLVGVLGARSRMDKESLAHHISEMHVSEVRLKSLELNYNVHLEDLFEHDGIE